MATVIGIDLGTTFSCVAIYRNEKAEVIPNLQGNRTTPSYVAFTENGRLTGETARAQAATNPLNTIYDAKRLIGRKYEDQSVQKDIEKWPFKVVNDNGTPMVEVQDRSVTKQLRAEEISAALLGELKETAENFLGEKVDKAVITVPAYFNDAQRQATKHAGTIAGLEVLRIINEPTAAALAYGFENQQTEDLTNILVFDLGGGTFDVTILAIDDGVYDVKSTNGDTHLGGEDFTNRIVEHFSKEITQKFKYDIRQDKKALGRLKDECERIKKALSKTTMERINLDYLIGDQAFISSIARVKFEQLNKDLFEKTLLPVEEALKDAKLQKSDINEIVLIGGSTRIPIVQNLLRDYFGGKQLNNKAHPDEAVAMGAAIQAAKLGGDESEALQEVVLLDVTPLSLGVEVVGGRMDVIIQRNSTIPCSQTKVFTTFNDNQTTVDVVVHEGERPLVKDNNQLGKFTLDGIPPQPRGKPDIHVTFQVNSDGILEVSATEMSGGKAHTIQIRNEKGTLSSSEIERMKREAEIYREEDKKEKQRVEVKLQLEELCLKLQSNLTFNTYDCKLSEDEKEIAANTCKEILQWLAENQNASKETILEKTKLFEEFHKLL